MRALALPDNETHDEAHDGGNDPTEAQTIEGDVIQNGVQEAEAILVGQIQNGVDHRKVHSALERAVIGIFFSKMPRMVITSVMG